MKLNKIVFWYFVLILGFISLAVFANIERVKYLKNWEEIRTAQNLNFSLWNSLQKEIQMLSLEEYVQKHSSKLLTNDCHISNVSSSTEDTIFYYVELRCRQTMSEEELFKLQENKNGNYKYFLRGI